MFVIINLLLLLVKYAYSYLWDYWEEFRKYFVINYKSII
jgi:hypothetical protein